MTLNLDLPRDAPPPPHRTWTPMLVTQLVVILAVLVAGLTGAALVAAYAALLWGGFHLRVIAYEEPHLRRQFGREYASYCAAVPRWLRMRPRRRLDAPPRSSPSYGPDQ